MKKPTSKQLLNLAAQHERYEANTGGKKALLAIDYGEKFCGLAVAPDGVTVLPAAVVNTPQLEEALESLIEQYAAKTIVLGMPISSDGSENHICKLVRALAGQYKNRFATLSIVLVNERFSSQAALSPDKNRIDDLAAMQILEFYLNTKQS